MRKIKKTNLLLKFGITIVVISLILNVLVFGATFGALFLTGIGFVIIIYDLLNKASKSTFKYKKEANFAKKIFSSLLAAWLLSFVVIQGLLLTFPLNEPDLNETATNYAITLGAGLWGEEPSPTLLRRLERTLKFLEVNPEANVIVSGGQSPGQELSEAEVMKKYLNRNNIDEDRIIKEENATNTKENIIYSRQIFEDQKEILEGEKTGENIEVVIITSDFHLFRAKFIARNYGLDPHGISAESTFFVKVNYLIREYFAVIKSFIVDT